MARLDTGPNFGDTECHNCGKIGHLAKVCRSSGGGRVNRNPQGGAKSAGKSPKRVDAVLPDNDAKVVDVLDQINTLGAERANPYIATLHINGKPVTMQIDKGASVSLISRETQKSLLP